jgi:putative ABC transport system permease protein
MFRLTIKNLWAHKVRFALTSVAVVLGVAFMAGTMVLTDTMGKTFDNMFATSNAGTDVVVQQPETVDTEFGDARERVPASVVTTVSSVDGVAVAAGSVQGFTQLVKPDGTVGSLDGLDATIGANWIADPTLNPFTISSGHAPEADDEVVLDRKTVEDNNWVIGDTVSVIAKGQPTTLTLVGVAMYGELSGMPGATLVATNDVTAQQLFAEPGYYDGVAISANDGVDSDELATRVDAALGSGTYDVKTGEAQTASQQDQFKQDLSFFNTFLMAFALVALFVGTFIIYNTFSILAAQRSKDMAMLRAIGAGRRQLLRSMLFESVAIGVIAGGLGLVAGVGMSYLLKGLLAAVGLEIPAGATVVSTSTIVISFVVGVTVTLVSALAPAIKASRIKPIAALRDVSVDRSGVSLKRTLVGLSVTGLGVAAFAAGVTGNGAGALQLLGLGAVTTIMGVFVLGPVIARPVIGLIGWPVAKGGITGELARENATRSPKRTSATAAALMVGVALVGFITILASSTKASVADAVDKSLRADYVVESGAYNDGGFTPELATQLESLDVVDEVAPLRSTAVGAFGGSSRVQGTDTDRIDALYDLEVVEGSIAAVGSGTVAVTRPTAESHDLTIGSTVTLTFARTGEVPLTVAAVHEPTMDSDSAYLIDLATYEANVTDQFDQKLFVSTVDGVDASAARAQLEGVLDAYPNAELQDQAQFKESITQDIDRMLNLIYGLLLLAVVIALIGIANTLALSIHERRREIGLLRAVGMTRGQVRRAVRWEAVLIALLGTALGALLAIGGAWGIVQALADQNITTFAVPTVQMVVITVLAACAGVVAAVGPARRAAKLDVLDAIGAG